MLRHPLLIEPAARLLARVAERVDEARAQTVVHGRSVLVSVVVAVPPVDPLDALEALHGVAGEERTAAADSMVTDTLAAGQMYWARPADGFAVAGVGAVATLAPAGPDRFAAVDRAWSGLLDGAILDDASHGSPGTGPVLLGGFAFDPAGPRAAHWRGFPKARLILPRVQLTTVGDATWLTATVLVAPDGAPDASPTLLGRLVRGLLGGGAPPTGEAPDAVADTTLADTTLDDDMLAFDDAIPAVEWRAIVADAVVSIRAGAFDKVVLARATRAVAPVGFDLGAALRQLREAFPTCYVFATWSDDGAVFMGASPERLVRLDGREVRASSLAGSAPRGPTAARSAAHATALLASVKDGAEHAIVRRALVGALAELCDDVRADAEPSLLTLANVYHLHTDVRARLRPGRSLLDLVARLHPTPAVGGAPREAALGFIRERERLDRGWYAAPVGWIGRDGGEFAVGLRSALVRGDTAWLFAGCGIVADSDPEREYAESVHKLRAMERALAAAATAPVAMPASEPAASAAVR